MKPLEGRVVPVWPTEHTTPDATTRAHHAAIVVAAQEYVQALRMWEEREGYAPVARQALHRKLKELIAAVEGR